MGTGGMQQERAEVQSLGRDVSVWDARVRQPRDPPKELCQDWFTLLGFWEESEHF